MTDCVLSGNTAVTAGGLFHQEGSAEIIRSTITGNSADTTWPGGHNGQVGGILTYNGTLALIDSTVSYNTAVMVGGGVYSNGSTLLISGSTVYGNTAEYAGGVMSWNNNSTLVITNSTICANTATKYVGGGNCQWWRVCHPGQHHCLW